VVIISQVILLINFVKNFLTENPLCVCSEEILTVKKKFLQSEDTVNLKQKTSQVVYRISVCIPFMFLLQKCIWQLELAATHLVINNQFIIEQSFFGQCVFKSGLYFLRIYFLTFLHHILLNF
jgi:hypothetical protein